jgi:hypothetical protein
MNLVQRRNRFSAQNHSLILLKDNSHLHLLVLGGVVAHQQVSGEWQVILDATSRLQTGDQLIRSLTTE